MINHSAVLEVNLNNLIQNYKYFKKITKPSIVAATIKANAYGIGDKMVYESLYKNGCRDFFVATTNEGYSLRNKFSKGNIYILNGLENNSFAFFKKNKLTPIINSKNELKYVNKNNFSFGIHIDTGLNRLGINIEDLHKDIFNNKNLSIVISHLASADEFSNNFNFLQKKKFKNYIKLFENKKVTFSISNSMGALFNKNFHFNLVRPGISLYGGHYNNKFKTKIKPVIKLKASILQIKKIKSGQYIGYNQTYKTKKSIWVAIVGIGYADGIPRSLSNKGFVFFKNVRYKIIGRISMDSITINITKNKKKFNIGDYVDLISYERGIDDFAKQCCTISNEVLTSISHRVKRIYK